MKSSGDAWIVSACPSNFHERLAHGLMTLTERSVETTDHNRPSQTSTSVATHTATVCPSRPVPARPGLPCRTPAAGFRARAVGTHAEQGAEHQARRRPRAIAQARAASSCPASSPSRMERSPSSRVPPLLHDRNLSAKDIPTSPSRSRHCFHPTGRGALRREWRTSPSYHSDANHCARCDCSPPPPPPPAETSAA
jgi:hypothetical protein